MHSNMLFPNTFSTLEEVSVLATIRSASWGQLSASNIYHQEKIELHLARMYRHIRNCYTYHHMSFVNTGFQDQINVFFSKVYIGAYMISNYCTLEPSAHTAKVLLWEVCCLGTKPNNKPSKPEKKIRVTTTSSKLLFGKTYPVKKKKKRKKENSFEKR